MKEKTKVEFIESYIKLGNSDYQWSDNHGELIRCRNCKYCFTEGFVHEHNICEKHEDIQGQPDDWYCADGERGDQDIQQPVRERLKESDLDALKRVLSECKSFRGHWDVHQDETESGETVYDITIRDFSDSVTLAFDEEGKLIG